MNYISARQPLATDALLTSSSNQELINQYLSWKETYTTTAFRAYRLWVCRFQNFVNKPPEFWSHVDYSAFANDLRSRHAPRGVQYALAIIHNYLRFFAEQGRLGFPLYLARVPRAFGKSYEAITEAEYLAIVADLRARPSKLRDLAAIMLLRDTGMRISELLSLEIDDIEEDRSAVVRTRKTIRTRRVFWNIDTNQILQKYLVERINSGPASAKCDALFTFGRAREGKLLTRRTIQRVLQDVLARVSITRKLSPHSFRHAFIHRLARLGVPDAIIAQLVGHSSPNSIAHYTKLSRPEFQHYARMQLESILEKDMKMAA